MAIAELDGVGSLQEQVRRTIAHEIATGRYQPGAQMPTEREYADRLGVSLITVRGALASLVQAGYIERASGRGTFVSTPRVPYQMRLMSSTTDSLRAAGVPFTVEVVVAGASSPPDDVRRVLALARRSTAYRLQRLVTIGQSPAILLDSWVRRSAARTFRHGEPFAQGASLYAELARQGIALAHADGRLELVYANDQEAYQLKLAFGAPLFAYESTARDDRGRVIERARALYDANRFSLAISSEIATGTG
jgi:GntR family transcriptional regulator